jgi:hypothetical protein
MTSIFKYPALAALLFNDGSSQARHISDTIACSCNMQWVCSWRCEYLSWPSPSSVLIRLSLLLFSEVLLYHQIEDLLQPCLRTTSKSDTPTALKMFERIRIYMRDINVPSDDYTDIREVKARV